MAKSEQEKRDEAKKKWMQRAVPKSHEGKFAQWCRDHGHDGVCQACINEAAKAGGHASRMANFAANANPDKYNYPKKE